MHCENKKGLLVVLSAPSGCGKDTVFRAIEALRDDVVESVSATTRAPRPGEVDGVNYFFKTRADFEKMIADGGFFEYAEYSGNYYGTPIAGVDQAIARGKVCFLIIEVQGAKNVMRICPDCVSIFLYPPNFEILEQRLRGRMSETDEVIRNRLEIAKVELQSRDCYKYQVLNDDLDTAVHEINHIICDELAKRNAE